MTIHGVKDPYQGLQQCHEGSTSGKQCGTDTAENVTVTINYPWGPTTMNGLSRNSACSSGGDSGGPWETNNYAVGIDIAAFGCPTPDSFYEPVSRASAQMHVHVDTG